MISAPTMPPRFLQVRTFLVLGRVSNLPTVWSNCLAGWALAGGGDATRFTLLCLGATLLYMGGMFLNDAFDAQYDQQHRRERPIPARLISAGAVWQWGVSWLLLGCLCLVPLGKTAAVLAGLLAATIFIYDAIHKIFAFSPIVMAVCRFLLLLLAASVGADGITGLSVWTALALGFYTCGLTYLARRETIPTSLQGWPCILLAAPLLLACVVNPPQYLFRGGILLCAILLTWVIRSLRFAFWSPQRHVGRCVAGLLAGMILVDLLAVGLDFSTPVLPFLSLFALALLLQRFVPAT